MKQANIQFRVLWRNRRGRVLQTRQDMNIEAYTRASNWLWKKGAKIQLKTSLPNILINKNFKKRLYLS